LPPLYQWKIRTKREEQNMKYYLKHSSEKSGYQLMESAKVRGACGLSRTPICRLPTGWKRRSI
jgi:hypothetical protein